MSRHGYNDDDDYDPLAHGRWRGALLSAIRGKRGQTFLREVLAALDAMPEKELVTAALQADGQFCTLGVVGHARGMDLEAIDPEDYEAVAAAFGINERIAREVMYLNDESISDDRWIDFEIHGPVRPHYPDWGSHKRSVCVPDTTAAARRWHCMRSYIAGLIIEPSKEAP